MKSPSFSQDKNRGSSKMVVLYVCMLLGFFTFVCNAFNTVPSLKAFPSLAVPSSSSSLRSAPFRTKVFDRSAMRLHLSSSSLKSTEGGEKLKTSKATAAAGGNPQKKMTVTKERTTKNKSKPKKEATLTPFQLKKREDYEKAKELRRQNNLKYVKEMDQNKEQAIRNRKKNTSKQDKLLADYREAITALNAKDKRESNEKWVKRVERKPEDIISMEDLEVASLSVYEGRDEEVNEEKQNMIDSESQQKYYLGKVITVRPFGAYIDIGSERDVFVHVKDFSKEEFVHDAREYLEQGQDDVKVYLSNVNIEENSISGSLIPLEPMDAQEERLPLSEVNVDDELWGEIVKVTNYGAFVDVGVEVNGFLHILDWPEEYRPAGTFTKDIFQIGKRVRVWAMDIEDNTLEDKDSHSVENSVRENINEDDQIEFQVRNLDTISLATRKRLKLTGNRPENLPYIQYVWGGQYIDKQ